ncbi:MAG: Rid family hydrolase [Conexibacter sp.]
MAQRTSWEARGPWTDTWGYARAVRVGDRIEVAGTSAIRANGEVAAVGDPYGQTVFVFEVIERALVGLGASLEDVVRTRAFLKRIEDWQEVGRRHAELFGEIAPASSCIGGIELLHPDLLVEIEATAVVGA